MRLHPNMRPMNGVKAKMLERVRNMNPALANDLSGLKLPWYTMRNVASADGSEGDTAEILIYDEIGGSFGIAADDFVAELSGITAANIIVRINSPGGDVFDAIAIYNALIQHKANITTRVDALAASAASIIAMAGDKVEMMVGGQLMIHDAMVSTVGNPAELREMAKFLDAQSDNLASVYANKGGTKTDWRAMMKAETWMFAEEAVGFGLADSVFTRTVRQAIEEEEVELDPDSDVEEEEAADDADSTEATEDKESDDEDIDAFLDNLMAVRHRTTNRGWKYSNRNAAPAPRAPGVQDLIEQYLG